MPFGEGCQFKDFEACKAALAGKVDDPDAACGALMQDTEASCKLKSASAQNWEASWQNAVPLSGRVLPFVVDAKKGADGAVESLHFRFASKRLKATWGFSALFKDSPKKGAAAYAYPKAFGSLENLEKSFLSGDGSKFVRKAAGTYRLGMASDNLVEVYLQSTDDHLRGRYVFQKDAAGFWTCKRPKEQGSAMLSLGLAEQIRGLKKSGARLAVIPRDAQELSRGYRLVDVAKAAARITTVRRIVKQSEEQRYTLGIAYPVKEVDAHGEYATAEEVEKAAWRFMRAPKVGLMHKDGTEGAGMVVESYIYRGPEWKEADQTIDPGDWMVGVVWGEDAWNLIKSGSIRGFSMQGWAKKNV